MDDKKKKKDWTGYAHRYVFTATGEIAELHKQYGFPQQDQRYIYIVNRYRIYFLQRMEEDGIVMIRHWPDGDLDSSTTHVYDVAGGQETPAADDSWADTYLCNEGWLTRVDGPP